MNKILITGATGLLGKAIVKRCQKKGVAVHYLTTDRAKLKSQPNYKGFFWDLKTGSIDLKAFQGVDTIINLAGSSIAKRWTRSNKNAIVSSRIDSVALLYNTVEENGFPIKQFISASAIGYYPDSEINYYDEDYASEETSFLVQLIKKWEQEADRFKSLNIKVSKIRVGIVLSGDGGALPKLVKPIKYFVGAPLGSGQQWQSWIHIDDIANLFLFIGENCLEGVFNGVAPNPVSQKNLTRTIARVLKKPILIPMVPAFVLNIILGKMSSIVVQGQRVSSNKIENLGFQFKYYQVEQAVEDLLKT